MSETTANTSDETSSKKAKDDDGSRKVPRKKAKKKKAKTRDGVPLFAQRYPRDETLDGLLSTFDRGDYATVREGAQKLIASSKKPAVRQAAEDLLRRLEPDPLARYLLAVATLLLVFFSISPAKRDMYILPALPMFVLALAPSLVFATRRRIYRAVHTGFVAVLALMSLLFGLAAQFGAPKFERSLI